MPVTDAPRETPHGLRVTRDDGQNVGVDGMLPCPFCGADGDDLFIVNGTPGQAYVACAICLADGPIGGTEGEAVASWDRRA